jgi:tetratricopeptide (TPR) repeat protein
MSSQEPTNQLARSAGIKDLISVVIPTYNHVRFLADAIQSALAQSYLQVEIIVVDDGSTDSTHTLVESFGERVHYMWQENQGLSGARNTGIGAAQGEYIALLDADDFWEPKYLETVHRVLAADPHLGAVYTGLQFVNSKGERLPQPCVATVPSDQLHDRLLDGEFFAPSAVLVRRTCFEQVGVFDVALRASEDWDMWLRVAQVYGFAGIAQPLLNYRVHGSNMSGDPEYMLRYQTMVVCKHFGAPEGEPSQWPAPRQRAWAATCYFAAQGYFLRGDDAKGQTFLRQAFEANPALTAQVDLFYELGCVEQPLGQRGNPATLNLPKSADRLLGALHVIFNDPTLAPRVQQKRRTALAHAYLALGLLAYNSQQREQARAFWVQALQHAPKLAMQRTFLTRLARTFVKPGLRAALRTLTSPGS